MKFQFDAHLPHQSSAINAVLGLFEGSEATDSRDVATAFQTFDTELFQGVVQTPMGLGNAGLERDGLFQRIKAVQERHGIDVSSTFSTGTSSQTDPFLKLDKVELRDGGGSIRAKVRLLKAGSTKASLVTVKRGDDLEAKAGGSEACSDNWVITEINATPHSEYLEFANGRIIAQGDELGGSNNEIVHQQIHETVISPATRAAGRTPQASPKRTPTPTS